MRLVAAVLVKDRKAAAEFVARYADAVYGYVRHRLRPRGDLVEDVVQDVFLAALASLGSYRGASPLRAWLLGIARHKVETFYRERLRQPDAIDDGDGVEPPDEEQSIDQLLDRDQMRARARDVLRELPEPYSVVLLWRYWEDRSVRDMAAATNRTEKAVERLLARARARFRELWEKP
jgi:RNA polymerase sigma-70 factor (ECF subfamily)